MNTKHQAFLTDEAQAAIQSLGSHIQQARKRRRWNQEALAERSGVGVATIGRLEKGEGSVGLAILANVLVALDLEESLLKVADPQDDNVGIALERRHQPKRIRSGGDSGLDTDF